MADAAANPQAPANSSPQPIDSQAGWYNRAHNRNQIADSYLKDKSWFQKLRGSIALAAANTVDAAYSFASNPIVGGLGGAVFGSVQGAVFGVLAAIVVGTVVGPTGVIFGMGGAAAAGATLLATVAACTVYQAYKGVVNAYHSPLEKEGSTLADNMVQGAGVPLREIQKSRSKQKEVAQGTFDVSDKQGYPDSELTPVDVARAAEAMKNRRQMRQQGFDAPVVPETRPADVPSATGLREALNNVAYPESSPAQAPGKGRSRYQGQNVSHAEAVQAPREPTSGTIRM
jgi:hypothetical protein